MGSCDGYSVCPQCGSVMVYNCWYHSGSYIYDCNICGFHGRKMIHYEDCLNRNDPTVDIDGYSRSCAVGHGIVSSMNHRNLIKERDDVQVSLSDDDVLYYETWVKDGRLTKIKITQAGLNKLQGMHVLLYDHKKYLAMNDNVRVNSKEILGVVSQFKVSPMVLEVARKNEHWFYLCDDRRFYEAVDAELHRTDGFYVPRNPFAGVFGLPDDKPDEQKVAEAKEKFMISYKEHNGKDFDFEKLLSHNEVECPVYGLENNVCSGFGREIEIDMNDVHDYYGVVAHKSGVIRCFPDKESAFHDVVHLIVDFASIGMSFDNINDISVIRVENDIVVETSDFKFSSMEKNCSLDDFV